MSYPKWVNDWVNFFFQTLVSSKKLMIPKILIFRVNTRIENGLVSASPPVHFILGYYNYNTFQRSDMIPSPLARVTACVRLFTPSFP